MKKLSDELKYPAKDSKLDQDLQPKSSTVYQPDQDRSRSDDPIADARRPDSDTLTPTPVRPVDNLDKDYDIKEFMSPDIGGELKKAALRKLFHSPEFNRRDGLDDYDEDFRAFEHLGDIITSDMRYHLKRLSEEKDDSRLKDDPSGDTQSDAIEKSAGTLDAKSHPVSHPKMVKSIPGTEKIGNLLLQPVLCAHGARGLTGCTRCLEACPAGAINTADDTILIDPERCRQKGLCTTVCPTDALKLSMHTGHDLLTSVRLSAAAAPDPNPAVIFYDADLDPALLQTIPAGTLEFCVDSIEAVGMEIWLAALAYGTSHVFMLAGKAIRPAVFDSLQTQVSWAAKILEGMGFEEERIQIIRADSAHQGTPFNDLIVLTPVRPTRPALFEPGDTKRAIIFQSIDYLHGQAHGSRDLTALAKGAPFGEIIIDPDRCTLCLACVAVCPAKALRDGQEVPEIRFIEGPCLQCGLCRSACPENAVRLSARMVFGPGARSSLRILHGAEPFCCVVCDRPFATKAVVDKMVQKLSGHWMYQNDGAKKCLSMCGDCRSKKFFETGGL